MQIGKGEMRTGFIKSRSDRFSKISGGSAYKHHPVFKFPHSGYYDAFAYPVFIYNAITNDQTNLLIPFKKDFFYPVYGYHKKLSGMFS